MQIKTYLILLSVFLLSFVLFFTLPGEEIIKNIAATPALCALIAAIYTILKDHSVHIKQLEIQQKEQNFSIGISSHMAQKAFERHIEFCEKYIAEVHRTSKTLIREGPTEKAREHGVKLSDLRIEYSTWITDDISNKLVGFENALYRLSAKVRLSNKTNDSAVLDKSDTEAEKIWGELLGTFLDKDKLVDANIAIESIVDQLRNILNVKELVELRGILVKRTIATIK